MYDQVPECTACGACCQNTFIPLNDQHALELRSAKTQLVERADQTMIYGPALRPGEKIYAMLGRCGYLAHDPATGSWQCTRYTSRPPACVDFERGDPNCADLRMRAGYVCAAVVERSIERAEASAAIEPTSE